jgi:RNA polymerase sigma-70 factor (ECF subfamily)
VDGFSVLQSFTARRSSAADDGACFQKIVLPHLDDAYALARWLTGNRADAEEVVQEACLQAYRGIGDCRRLDARVRVLAIVHRVALAAAPVAIEKAVGAETPETAMDATQIEAAIAALPALFRATIVLRDVLGLPYREIAEVIEAPTGAVVWRLAEARRQLLAILATMAPDRGSSRQTDRPSDRRSGVPCRMGETTRPSAGQAENMRFSRE